MTNVDDLIKTLRDRARDATRMNDRALNLALGRMMAVDDLANDVPLAVVVGDAFRVLSSPDQAEDMALRSRGRLDGARQWCLATGYDTTVTVTLGGAQ